MAYNQLNNSSVQIVRNTQASRIESAEICTFGPVVNFKLGDSGPNIYPHSGSNRATAAVNIVAIVEDVSVAIDISSAA